MDVSRMHPRGRDPRCRPVNQPRKIRIPAGLFSPGHSFFFNKAQAGATVNTAKKRKASRVYVVRKSAIHGRGVFATVKIRKGKSIVEYKGKRITWDEAMDAPDSDPWDPAHTFLFELNDGRLIDARIRGNAARWINHSCAPNCVTSEDEDGRVFIEARRRIRAGEELTYDYGLSVDAPLTKKERAHYVCRCGAPKCRGSLLYGKRKRGRDSA